MNVSLLYPISGKNLHEDIEPPPMRPLQKRPQEQRPKVSTQRRRRCKEPQTEIPHPPRRVGDGDHGHRIRHDTGTPNTSEGAHRHKSKEVLVAECTQKRTQYEPGAAAQEQFPVAVDVAETTAHEDECPLCQASNLSFGLSSCTWFLGLPITSSNPGRICRFDVH